MENSGNNVDLSVPLTKQDWLGVVQWVNARWTTNWSDNDIVSLYNDYQLIPKDVIWKSLFLYFKAGNKFFNTSDFFALCHEQWKIEENNTSSQNALGMGEVVDVNANGLLQYLLVNGYESVRHAVYDISQKRVRENRPFLNEADFIDPDEPWESAKEHFTSFKWNRTVEELKEKVESQEDSNGK
jgi:hypothetical protein